MGSYKQLRKEFDKKVKELQKKCPHKKITGWLKEYWAVGHSRGFEVKVCENCNKVIKRRIECEKCGEWAEDYVEGDGERRPLNQYYCKKCDSEVN